MDQAYGAGQINPNIFEILYEKAEENVKKGRTCFGLKYDKGVMLAGLKKKGNALLDMDSVEKVYEMYDNLGAAYSGLTGDAEKLWEFGMYKSGIEDFNYDVKPNVRKVADELCKAMQMQASTMGARPFNVRFLLGGYDDKPHLFETNPLGSIEGNGEMYASAIGEKADDVKKFFEGAYTKGIDRAGAEELASKALALLDDGALTAEYVDFAIIDKGGFRRLPTKEVQEIMDKAKKKP